MTSAFDLIRRNDIAGARAALIEAVKRAPADGQARYDLAEVLILQGDWERADNHLDLASTQDPTLATVVALLRQLVRAAVHREEVFTAGRSPDLVTEPTPVIETAMRILLESRTGEDAGGLRTAADDAAPELAGACDGAPFRTLRDLDDRTADVLELLTPTGKYVWAPWSQVISLKLLPLQRPRERVWRPAELELRDGPSGVVYLPMIYPAPAESMNDTLRLGRETAWEERAGLTCGLGQRCLLVGEDMTALSGIGELTLDPEGQG